MTVRVLTAQLLTAVRQALFTRPSNRAMLQKTEQLRVRVPGSQGWSLLFPLGHSPPPLPALSEARGRGGRAVHCGEHLQPQWLCCMLLGTERRPRTNCSSGSRAPGACRQVLGDWSKCGKQLRTSPGDTWSWSALESTASQGCTVSPKVSQPAGPQVAQLIASQLPTGTLKAPQLPAGMWQVGAEGSHAQIKIGSKWESQLG